MPIPMPAVDLNLCSGWNQQDVDLYNKLPFYLAKMQADRRKTYPVWAPLLGKIRWTPNMGGTMRSVKKEPSPILRQFAFPNEISLQPKKDVMDVRERKQDEQVYAHDFESPQLSFVPEFRDFLRDHIDVQGKDIQEKQEVFEDVFYRGRIFHASPFVGIPGNPNGSVTAAPVGVGNAAGTDAKTTNWLQAQIPLMVDPGLGLEFLNLVLTYFENDIGAVPFSGSSAPASDQKGLDGKFLLILSSEAWNQFSLDPFLLAYKNCSLDIINGRFQGNLFGRIICRIESKAMRFKLDGTFPVPETREGNPDAYNYGETVPNPVYTGLDDASSPCEGAFLCGQEGYDVIEVGPPPSKFASSGMPEGFGKMKWNGELEFTKNFLVPCIDDAGAVTYDTNRYGRFGMFQSSVTYGIRRRQPRFVLPLLFKRKRGR